MDTLSIDIAFGNRVAGAGVVTAAQFGAIQTGFAAFPEFDAQMRALGLSHLRWPGGTLAETDPAVYGLDLPGIFDGTRLFTPDPDRVRPDLAATLAHCVEQNLGFSMILPTVRHAADIERGVAELQAFLRDLLSGRHGALPANVTLEIGNEYEGHAVLAQNPALYGQIADRFIQTITAALASPEVNQIGAELRIAVQMGASAGDDAAIRGAIAPGNLVQIDSLVVHALPFNFAAIDKPRTGAGTDPEDLGESAWQNRADYLAAWQAAIAAAGGDGRGVDFYVSAVNVGKAAQDFAEVNLTYQDYGLRAAGAYLELFATYQSIGMDAAAIWGVAGKHFNAVSDADAQGIVLDPGGALIRLMAENIVGMQLIDGFQANGRDDPAMAYAWENATEAVIFVAANDIPSDGLSIRIDLDLLGAASLVEATRLTAVLDEDCPPGATPLQRMVYENAHLADFVPAIAGGSVSFRLGGDYEVVMLHLARAPAAPAPSIQGTAKANSIKGTAGADAVYGNGGNDKLWGEDGDDYLSGGVGKDVLQGGAGNDRIDGDADNDRLLGGTGADTLSGGDGNDDIQGNAGDDSIEGGAGNDAVLGGDGADAIWGGDGNDRLSGELGDDRIEGGTGRDSIFGNDGADTVFGGGDEDAVNGGAGDDRLFGGSGNDTLTGEGGRDILSGGLGNDLLAGGADADVLRGEEGADTLKGEAGADMLDGGAGNDLVIGGLGDDLLAGGEGADLFLFEKGFGMDRIEDFEAGVDRIQVSALRLKMTWADFVEECATETGAGVTLAVRGGLIELAGVALADLSAGDFLL